MTMKRTSFRRQYFKKSRKSAASLIFAIEGFAVLFESVQSSGRCRGTPVRTGFGLGFGETIRHHNLPTATTAGSTCFGRGESGF